MRCTAGAFVAFFLALAVAQAAQAQTIVINRPNNGPAVRGEKNLQVSVNLQLSMPTPALTSTPEWTKAIATANQSLFEIINRECNVLARPCKATAAWCRSTPEATPATGRTPAFPSQGSARL